MKAVTDQNTHKMNHVEAALSEQVDLVHSLNDKISQSVERFIGPLASAEKRIGVLEEKFVELVEQVGRQGQGKGALERIEKVLSLLQKNDTQ